MIKTTKNSTAKLISSLVSQRVNLKFLSNTNPKLTENIEHLSN